MSAALGSSRLPHRRPASAVFVKLVLPISLSSHRVIACYERHHDCLPMIKHSWQLAISYMTISKTDNEIVYKFSRV